MFEHRVFEEILMTYGQEDYTARSFQTGVDGIYSLPHINPARGDASFTIRSLFVATEDSQYVIHDTELMNSLKTHLKTPRFYIEV